MKIILDMDQVAKLEQKMSRFPRVFAERDAAITRDAAQQMLEWARRFATSDGGPRVITGAYAAGFTSTVEPMGPHKVFIGLTNSVPYGWRLEFGFYGMDSLGRTYNQSGFFVMTRAVMQVANDYKKELRRNPLAVWRSL